ncbi:MAG: UDP-N-acetylmuramoyl-tripeptide--D-alanyl-D-alanine ligase [Anaerolineae bacterium]|nr:UDP-N-acetylmuramoyl-tripeptide--D-alanyl-D-alanine ligase [Gloeobacterales cyanobacterium ES-bin-313]
MTFAITSTELCTLLAAEVVGLSTLPEKIIGITTDSRAITPGSLFVPLIGERFDGHDYLEIALANGAALVLSEKPVSVPHLRVADTLRAYQQLGRWWRQQFTIPVVAVTGSAGKTTTRELIRAVLATAGSVLASTGNENNDIGVPKLLLQLDKTHRFCVVEMGMRGPGEIARLTQCALPNVGVITNVGSAHIGRLGGLQAIADAKCELLADLPIKGTAILNGEDERLLTTSANVWSGSRLTFGLNTGDLRGRLEGDTLWVEGVSFPVLLPGRHNVLNFLAALAVARSLDLELSTISTQLNSVALPEGRSHFVQIAGLTLIDETYNSAPESAQAALDLLAQLPGTRRIAVLGQMRELGEFSADAHHKVGERCAQLGLDQLFVLAGEDTDALANAAKPIPVEIFLDQETLTQRLAQFAQPGDFVLFKASRAIGLERVLKAFQQLLV